MTHVEEVEAVQESVLHLHCITAFFLVTVFDKCHGSPLTNTAYKELPVCTHQLVFEDVPENQVSVLRWYHTLKNSHVPYVYVCRNTIMIRAVKPAQFS